MNNTRIYNHIIIPLFTSSKVLIKGENIPPLLPDLWVDLKLSGEETHMGLDGLVFILQFFRQFFDFVLECHLFFLCVTPLNFCLYFRLMIQKINNSFLSFFSMLGLTTALMFKTRSTICRELNNCNVWLLELTYWTWSLNDAFCFWQSSLSDCT